MSRYPKPPIELSPIFLRYLDDIEGEQEERNENKNIEPLEMFLVFAWRSGEVFHLPFEEFEDSFLTFKKYFTSEKILEFPTLDEFATKYNFKWKIEDIMEHVIIDRRTRITFEKMFPVKVLNFKKLQEFRSKYCGPQKTTPPKTPKPRNVTDFNKDIGQLTKSGLVSYDFQKAKHQRDNSSLRIFKLLWEHRHHIVRGEVKARHKGKPITFNNFVVGAKLLQSGGLGLTKGNTPKYQAKIRSVVTNIKKKKKYPFTLMCSTKAVQLTVKD